MQTQVDGFRLSPQQRDLWSWQTQHGRSSLHARCALKLDGQLSVRVLREALHRIVERHEILRTAFLQASGMRWPVQEIFADTRPVWRELDFSGQDAGGQVSNLPLLFDAEVARPHDLERGSMLHVTLFKLAAEEHALFISLPALCADAVSLQNLVEEIGANYAACLKDQRTTAAEPMQYIQFSEWQNELIESAESAPGRDFWREQEMTATPPLSLPFEKRDNCDAPCSAPESLALTIDAGVLEAVKKLAARDGLSTRICLLACWQTLLWRLTERTDVVISCGFNGRKYDELHDALGLYARRLPVACHFTEGARLTEILQRVGEAQAKANEWQEYFTWELEDGASSINHPRIFDEVAFEYEERADKFNSGGLAFSLLEKKVSAPACKLLLSCVQTPENLTAEFTFEPQRFDCDDIERLAMQFHKLLASTANNPDAPLSTLDFLSDAEREQLVFAFNRTATDYPQDKCVHELFEAQVECTPHNVAVVCGDERVTYAELNARSNQLAHYLRGMGVESETFVGICLERSIEMVVGILGVLKAGGAYVPLDPQYPQERLQFMMQDTDAGVLLTQAHLLPKLPEHTATLVCPDRDRDKIDATSAENPSRTTFSDSLAYVIYTSGSTGRPKGVMIPHQGVVNYLNWCTKAYAVADGEGAPVHSPLGFDLTVTSLFAPLLVGKCVTLVAEGQGIDGLGDMLAGQSGFSLVKITPSHLEVLKHRLPPDDMAGRARALVIGGEALFAETLTHWRAFAPETKLINEYGPTETVVGSCIYEVQPESATSGVIPIGRPIANTQLYLLDDEWQLVPFGVSGELYIGGDGVARGYLRRPELTAERFIPNPFSNQAGARLYRTGDLVRFLPNGELEYLGRLDQQVKIRGHRIELGEIEAFLNEHESVRQCVVIAREDVPGDKRLVAYLVTQTGVMGVGAELGEFLRERLPEYMVPTRFVELAVLPMTPNGKIDRGALPRPEASGLRGEAEYLGPRTVVEEVVCGIWSEVLGVERVGVRENFFELGGHSLLATQVVSRLRSAFSVEIALQSLFDKPTVEGLAEVVEAARAAGEGLQTPPLHRVSRDGLLPVSFAQRRLWFFHQSKPESTENLFTLGIRVAGPLNVGALTQALNEIVRRHEVLRMSFVAHEGEPFQVIAAAHDFALPLIDLSELNEKQREEEALLLFAREEQRRFDLTSSPLMRAMLLRMEAESHVLMLTLHHLVSDGWSHSILLREMAVLYRAFSAGKQSPLAELQIQYADYASWQRNWLQGSALEEQLGYWKQQLSGAHTFLNLPTDHPRPDSAGYGQCFPAAIQNFALSADLSKKIKALSNREGMSLFMTLLGAFQALLARQAGQDDISVGTPIAGRNRAETEKLIGMFVNQLTLRTDLSGNPTFRELLRRVRSVTFDAYAHQELPFNQVVEVLNPEASGDFKLPFQVKFRVENTPDETPQEALALANLSLNYFAPRAKPLTVKLDHVLSMREESDCLTGQWMYNAALFEQLTIDRLIEDFQTILSNAVANPEERLRDLLPAPQSELCAVA